MDRLKKNSKRFFNILKPSLLAISVGLFFGFIVMLIVNPGEAFEGFWILIRGGFNPGIPKGDVFYKGAPIILTGLAVGFAFKMGLFNIGASGQMMIGAYVAVHVGILWELPPTMHWIVAIVLGTLAGGIWGMIPGLLKAVANVHEVVSSIMMNYIAGFLLVFLIDAHVANIGTGNARPIIHNAQIPILEFISGTRANIGIFIVIIIALIVHVVMHKTTFGFQLKASGFSIEGSKYAGINTKRNIVIAMVVSGMLAGMAGPLTYLSVGNTLAATSTIFSEGFDGISVALIGLGEPIGAIFAGFFMSHLKASGTAIAGSTDFSLHVVNIIVAVIIYATAISAAIQIAIKTHGDKIKHWYKNRKIKEDK